MERFKVYAAPVPVLLLLLLLTYAPTTIEAKFYSTAIARERLVTDLFVNYNPAVRPALKGERIDVAVNIALQHFEFHPPDGAFHLVGLLDVSWRDPKLVWNPRDYNNLTRIPISRKIVWIPDLEVYNNAPDRFVRMHASGMVTLDANGTVLWTDTIDMQLFCTPEMRDWPHDEHQCKLSLGSWTYDGYELDITNANPRDSMNFWDIRTQNTEYVVTNFSAMHVATVYQCCAEPYISIDYHLTFKRRAAFAVLFRVPALCVILFTLLALLMEPWRVEKLWLNAVSIVIISSNLLYFAKHMGSFTRETPLIVIFFSCSLVLVTLAHLVCVFALLATRSRYRGRLPPAVNAFLRCWLARVVAPQKASSAQRGAAKRSDTSESANAQFEDVTLQECCTLIASDATPSDWTRLATVVERCAVIVFGVSFALLATKCFV